MRESDEGEEVVGEREGVSQDKDLEQVELRVNGVFEQCLEAVDALRTLTSDVTRPSSPRGRC